MVTTLRDQLGGRAEDPLPPAGIPPPLVWRPLSLRPLLLQALLLQALLLQALPLDALLRQPVRVAGGWPRR